MLIFAVFPNNEPPDMLLVALPNNEPPAGLLFSVLEFPPNNEPEGLVSVWFPPNKDPEGLLLLSNPPKSCLNPPLGFAIKLLLF